MQARIAVAIEDTVASNGNIWMRTETHGMA
jgi:hypothetical protein